jgi:hypothetical protein
VSDSSWLQVTNGAGVGSGKFTVSIVNPGNVIGGATNLWGQITVSAPSAPIANGGVGSVTGAATPIVVRLNIQQSTGSSATSFGSGHAGAERNRSGWRSRHYWLGPRRHRRGLVGIYRTCFAFDPPAACQVILGHNVLFIGNATFIPGARPDVRRRSRRRQWPIVPGGGCRF